MFRTFMFVFCVLKLVRSAVV